MTDLSNPRAVIGDNINIDQAQIVNDRLALDYAKSVQTVDKLLRDATAATGNLASPCKVSSDVEALSLGAIIKQLRDHDNGLEAYREAEKQPYLRGGNAVDNFFFALRDKLGRRKKGDRSVRPGAIDVLQGMIDNWQAEKRAAENARLEQERLEAARLAREQAARHAKALEEAEAARIAAERARKEETRATKGAIADAAAAAAALAESQAALAAEQAEEARRATLVKDADIVRVRAENGGGVLLTSKQEGFAFVTDRSLIDFNVLKPFFTDFEVEKALRAWAKAVGFKTQMPGTEIGFRNRGGTR